MPIRQCYQGGAGTPTLPARPLLSPAAQPPNRPPGQTALMTMCTPGLLQSEKNKLAWSKQRLAELLPGAEARLEGAGAPSGSPYLARVTEVKSVDGEVGALLLHALLCQLVCCTA